MDPHSPDNDASQSAAGDAEVIDAARREVEKVAEAGRAEQRRGEIGDSNAPDSAAASLTRKSPSSGKSAFSGPPPDSFAGYQILKEIHHGGQGVVYQAVQKSTNRKVAIKVMKEGPFAGSADRARFDREVQVLGQLNHPSIVTIHDTGVAAGSHFFVMDYVRGQPLDVYMASGERSIDETLRLFAEICDAVNAAHLRGVIHRDLKPGNIRIDPDGRPHILDFGLAKVATTEAEAAAMTMTGQFVGSLPWASPEQAEGSPGRIDVRTDVYSLGVVAYQMLTGKFPYEVIGNMRDVLDRIMRAEPARPSTVRRQINDEVETIILKCLGKERERRYQTAGELARDVRHYLAGEPLEAKRDSGWYVLRKVLGRHKVTVGVAAAFSVLLGFSVVITGKYYAEREANRIRQQAEVAWARAQSPEDVVHLPAERHIAEGDPNKRYLLVGPKTGAPVPAGGFRLLVVLPGGDGSEDFHPFVKRIAESALPDSYVVAQPTAVRWSGDQFDSLVWPTEASPWSGMRFSTEQFVESVIRDVQSDHPIDAAHVFVLGWSSGGPPCYALSLRETKLVTGFVIAMSPFRPGLLPPLEHAAGSAYALLHSPDDQLVPINHAYRAHDALRENGAVVTVIEYPGGHGWHGDVYGTISEGVRWLEQQGTRGAAPGSGQNVDLDNRND